MPAPTSTSRIQDTVQEGDIAANEARLQHAEASRLVKSWLSSALGDQAHEDDRAEAELDENEKKFELGLNRAEYSETYVTTHAMLPTIDFFTSLLIRFSNKTPYRGGLGFVPQPSTLSTSTSRPGNPHVLDPTTTILRKRLLRGGHTHATAKTGPPFESRSANGPKSKRGRDTSASDEEEESRSGLGKGKSKAKSDNESNAANGKINGTTLATQTTRPTHLLPAKNTTTEAETAADTAPHLVRASASFTSKKRGTSYLDELLASRAQKKNKKKKSAT